MRSILLAFLELLGFIIRQQLDGLRIVPIMMTTSMQSLCSLEVGLCTMVMSGRGEFLAVRTPRCWFLRCEGAADRRK